MTMLPHSKRQWPRLTLFLVVSVVLHALVVLVMWLPPWAEPPTPSPSQNPSEPSAEIPPPPQENPEFKVSVIHLPPPPPEPEKTPEKTPEDQHLQPRQERDLKAVEQVTNQETPELANYVSEQANKVEKDQRAEEVTRAEVEPGEENPVRQEVEERLAEEAREAMAPKQTPELAETEPTEPGEGLPPVDLHKLFAPPKAAMAVKEGPAEQTAREAMKAQEGRKKILSDFEARDLAMRGALENFISEVEVGNHTGVNAYSDAAATYMARIHRKIHTRWADGYLPYLDTRIPMGSPLRDPSLNTKVEMVINGVTGVVEKVNIVKSSGQTMYDAEAVVIAQTIGPHGEAPREVISPNGKVYIHWNFWRDSRQCGTFGASVFIVNKDG